LKPAAAANRAKGADICTTTRHRVDQSLPDARLADAGDIFCYPENIAAQQKELFGNLAATEQVHEFDAEAAGADVLYSSGVRDLDTIRTVVAALRKPFNLVMGFADPTLTVDQLSAAGVKRISVGGAMSRFALAAFLQSAREMKDNGAFTFVTKMAPIKELRDGFAAGGS
jgi:hypothetical protein